MSIAPRMWAIVIVLAMGSFAQESKKPDFSGTWQLDLPRTRFGDLPKPKSLTIQIEHHEPKIRLLIVNATDQGETREALELTTDGKPYPKAESAEPGTATARWDLWSGDRLIVEVSRQGSSLARRFTLGAKGKILTTVLTSKNGSGEKTAYEFFTRQ